MTCTVEITQHALSQRSPARSGIENSWPKGKAKVKGRSSYKQHALNQRSPAESIGKGQKLIEAARPERAEALSPGQRPGLSCSRTWRPVR